MTLGPAQDGGGGERRDGSRLSALLAPCSRAARFPPPGSRATPTALSPPPSAARASAPPQPAPSGSFFTPSWHPGVLLPESPPAPKSSSWSPGAGPAVLLGSGGVKPRRQWDVAFLHRHPGGRRRARARRTKPRWPGRFPTETGEQSAP